MDQEEGVQEVGRRQAAVHWEVAQVQAAQWAMVQVLTVQWALVQGQLFQ